MTPGSKSLTRGISVQAKPADSGCSFVHFLGVGRVMEVNKPTDKIGNIKTLKKSLLNFKIHPIISIEIDSRDFVIFPPLPFLLTQPRMPKCSRISFPNENSSSSLPLWTITWKRISCSVTPAAYVLRPLQVVEFTLVGQTSMALMDMPVQGDAIIYRWLAVRSRPAIWNLEHAPPIEPVLLCQTWPELEKHGQPCECYFSPDFPLLWKIQGTGDTMFPTNPRQDALTASNRVNSHTMSEPGFTHIHECSQVWSKFNGCSF